MVPPTGSARPPRQRCRKFSAAALKAILFTGRAKPWPSSGNTTYVTGMPLAFIAVDDLFALRDIDPRIVGALADQQRPNDLVGGVQRRTFRQQLPARLGVRVAHPLVELNSAGFPISAGWS